MKVSQIIDEMQASLTKLRGHFRKTGTATEDIARQVPLHYCTCPSEIPCPVHDRNYQGLKKKLTGTADPYICCVCGRPAVGGHGTALGARIGYCRLHWPETKTTAGECRCPNLCRVHCQHDHKRFPVTPDLPLKCPWCNHRLHKDSNGHDVCVVCPYPQIPLNARVAKALGKRTFKSHVNDYYLVDSDTALDGLVPDYPNDLVAAMGALEEYCRKNSGDKVLEARIDCLYTGYYVSFQRRNQQLKQIEKWACYASKLPLPQAICEAIVTHSEGK